MSSSPSPETDGAVGIGVLGENFLQFRSLPACLPCSCWFPHFLARQGEYFHLACSLNLLLADPHSFGQIRSHCFFDYNCLSASPLPSCLLCSALWDSSFSGMFDRAFHSILSFMCALISFSLTLFFPLCFGWENFSCPLFRFTISFFCSTQWMNKPL